MAVRVEDRNDLSHLRLVRLRSDKIHESDIELCKKILSPTAIIAAGLATTETGTMSICLMDQGSEILNNEVPVGFPMEDKYISLIDDDGREVGFNAVGEIVVRSKYLSPGYWNNPDLTRTKFNNDPEDPNIRIYYTGDFGLMRPDGCLIHKGRKDSRIKIRGYAVDLVEVEETLRNHTEITDAVAVARPDESGEARLIAYFISRSQPGPVVSELRSFMKETLAEYSVPSVYVKIGESGSRRAQAFCGRCGSPLYVYDADHPKSYGLRVGCIEERAQLVPHKQKWCRSALPWTASLAGIERRETE
jgi:acyl-coenzyme A synthetase/AMP-(fatty) acid ligase